MIAAEHLAAAYDANGNATQVGAKSFTYDAENHLTGMTTSGTVVSIIYDAFGNRVAKTVNGVTTKYLVEDDVNPTGYAQVVEELVGGAVTRQYTYGLQRISENQLVSGVWTPSFYGYDGGGNVRQLTNSAGAVTDTYEYDAFGNDVYHTGTTPNNYLYRGEQYDPDLGLYYLRARYYNPNTGRFMSRDPEAGYAKEPASLHKYLYANGDPTNRVDPTGRAAMLEFLFTTADISTPTEAGLVALAGGTAATVTSWAIAVEVAAEEITGYLAEVAAEEAAGQAAAAWNSLVAAINEYGALLTEESIWGGINRLLLCTDVGLISAQIAEHTGILSPNGAHFEEVTSILGCGIGLEFVVKR